MTADDEPRPRVAGHTSTFQMYRGEIMSFGEFQTRLLGVTFGWAGFALLLVVSKPDLFFGC